MATDKPQQTAGNAEKALQSASDRAARTAHDTIETLSDYGARAEETLRETGRRVTERSREYAEEFGSYVARRPIVSLSVALGVGLLLGALVRGRG
jgi:ElaB/YqjD/DUF883 family membrane-anchored ribosome-binding protein